MQNAFDFGMIVIGLAQPVLHPRGRAVWIGDGVFILPVAVGQIFEVGDLSGQFDNDFESGLFRAVEQSVLNRVIAFSVFVKTGRPDDGGVQAELFHRRAFCRESGACFVFLQQKDSSVNEFVFHVFSSSKEYSSVLRG